MNKTNATVFKFEDNYAIVVFYSGGDFDVCDDNGVEYLDTFEDLERCRPEYAKAIDEFLKGEGK